MSKITFTLSGHSSVLLRPHARYPRDIDIPNRNRNLEDHRITRLCRTAIRASGSVGASFLFDGWPAYLILIVKEYVVYFIHSGY